MEYQIARTAKGLVMLQREDNANWTISKEMTEHLLPISITMGYKEDINELSMSEKVQGKSTDKATQILLTLSRFIESGNTEVAKVMAVEGEKYYTTISPFGIYVANNSEIVLVDDSTYWTERYARAVLEDLTEMFKTYNRAEPFSIDCIRTEIVFEYYHNEIVAYAMRNPELIKEFKNNSDAIWLSEIISDVKID